MGKIRSAKIERSKRLQRAFMFLVDGRWHTTREFQRGAGVCNPNTCKAELLDNGLKVECKREGDRWYYRMDMDRNARIRLAGFQQQRVAA